MKYTTLDNFLKENKIQLSKTELKTVLLCLEDSKQEFYSDKELVDIYPQKELEKVLFRYTTTWTPFEIALGGSLEYSEFDYPEVLASYGPEESAIPENCCLEYCLDSGERVYGYIRYNPDGSKVIYTEGSYLAIDL